MKQYEVKVDIQNLSRTKQCRLTRTPIICDIQYGYKTDIMMMMMMMIVHCEQPAFISVNIHILIFIYSFLTAQQISTTQFFFLSTLHGNSQLPPYLLADLHTHTTPCHLKVSHHFPFNDPVGMLCLLVIMIMSSQRPVTSFWNQYRKHQVWSSV